MNTYARLKTCIKIFLLYMVSVVAAFPDVVFSGRSFMQRDIARYYFPIWHETVRWMRTGQLPLWHPDLHMGAPFLADVQTCVLYPLSAILYLPDYVWAFNVYILFHLVLAGFFTYVWMRECNVSRVGAFLAGLAFLFSGTMISLIDLTISLCSVCYFPAILFCYRRALRSAGFGWTLAASLTLCFQYLAGDPSVQLATLAVLFVMLFFQPQPLRSFKRTALILALFVGVIAVQLFPFIELVRLSERMSISAADRLLWSFPPKDLPGFIVPGWNRLSIYIMDYHSRQSWLKNSYGGVGVILLALSTLRFVREKTIAAHWWLVFFGCLASFGKFTIFYPTLAKVMPLLSLMRFPVRLLFLCSFGLACLAGFGWDGIRRMSGRFWVSTAIVAGVLSCWLALNSGWAADGLFAVLTKNPVSLPIYYAPDRLWREISVFLMSVQRSLALAVVFGILIGFWGRRLIFRPWVGVVIVVVLLGDLFWANAAVVPRMDGKLWFQSAAKLSIPRPLEGRVMTSPVLLGREDAAAAQAGSDPEERFRCAVEQFLPNLTLLCGVSNVMGYGSVMEKRNAWMQNALRFLPFAERVPLINLAGVRYIASPKEDLGPDFVKRVAGPSTNIFFKKQGLPRAFFVESAEVQADDAAVTEQLLSPFFDPLKKIFLAERPSEALPDGGAGGSTVEITSSEPGRVALRTQVGAKKWLFLEDSYYPGWKATVDGERTRIYRADVAFRAIFLGAGRHRVEFYYEPDSFKWGLAATLVTLLFIVIRIQMRSN